MKIDVLDHGYVSYVEHWGSDERIIESARMSTDKGFLGWDHYAECRKCGEVISRLDSSNTLILKFGDSDCAHDWREVPKGDGALLEFLWKKKHSTPFEFAGLTIETQAPIFVFREWERHRTQSYTELSARYSPIPDVNYIPSIERIMQNSDGKNKQAGSAKGSKKITKRAASVFRNQLIKTCADSEKRYQSALVSGVPKELARLHIPVTRYSKMRASANLRNWLAFETLRYADDAQWEIREYAKVVHGILTEKFPRTLKLFDENR